MCTPINIPVMASLVRRSSFICRKDANKNSFGFSSKQPSIAISHPPESEKERSNPHLRSEGSTRHWRKGRLDVDTPKAVVLYPPSFETLFSMRGSSKTTAWFSPALPHIADLEAAWLRSDVHNEVATLELLLTDGNKGIDYFFCDLEIDCAWVTKYDLPVSAESACNSTNHAAF